MNPKRRIAVQYIEYLEKEDLDNLLKLFSENAVVDSPVFGVISAPKFYKKLIEDTKNSELKILEIFDNSNSNNIALYFSYKWTLVNEQVVEFDVVDIIEFDENNKITKLKIIYDTLHSRTQVGSLKHANREG